MADALNESVSVIRFVICIAITFSKTALPFKARRLVLVDTQAGIGIHCRSNTFASSPTSIKPKQDVTRNTRLVGTTVYGECGEYVRVVDLGDCSQTTASYPFRRDLCSAKAAIVFGRWIRIWLRV